MNNGYKYTTMLVFCSIMADLDYAQCVSNLKTVNENNVECENAIYLAIEVDFHFPRIISDHHN